jgi:hypothetical protein
MKKFITALALMVGLAASAQNFQSGSFITYPLIVATNTVGITNLNKAGSYPTNIPYTKYFANGKTNIVGAAGDAVTATATANIVFSNSVNLLRDVALWARPNGGVAATIFTTNSGPQAGTEYFEKGDATISVTYRSGAGLSASGIQLVFAPVWDGNNASPSPSLGVPITLSTNVPMSRFAGARALRLHNIVNADTDGSNEVFLDVVRINGYHGVEN